jgi:hypothetical protein
LVLKVAFIAPSYQSQSHLYQDVIPSLDDNAAPDISKLHTIFSYFLAKMTQIEATTDRHEIVKIISDFYNFLTTFPYLPASSIKAPPRDGWPEDVRETFRKMGKTDQVVDLLSHLPYVDSSAWEVFPDTEPIDYTSSRSLKRIDRNVSLDPPHCEIPDHVVSLTCGRNYGIWLLLDTNTGMFFCEVAV